MKKEDKKLGDTRKLSNVYDMKSRKRIENSTSGKQRVFSDGEKNKTSSDAKRRAYNVRKKKIMRFVRGGFLVLVAAGIVFSLLLFVSSMFFKVEKINVVYTNSEEDKKFSPHYSTKEIINVSEIDKDDNLLFLSLSSAGKKIINSLSYIYDVDVEKDYPHTVKIIISQSKEVFSVKTDNSYYILNEFAEVLGTCSKKEAEKYTLLTGMKIAEIKIGDVIPLTKNSEKIISFLKEFGECNIKKMTKIDLTDVDNIIMNYDKRITVDYGVVEDKENDVSAKRKLALMKKTLEKEDSMNKTQRGSLNMTIPDKAYFRAETDSKSKK